MTRRLPEDSNKPNFQRKPHKFATKEESALIRNSCHRVAAIGDAEATPGALAAVGCRSQAVELPN